LILALALGMVPRVTNAVKRSFKRLRDVTGGGSQAAQQITAPAEPSVDEAIKNRGEMDRIKRRRGVLANIFGGASSSGSPTVAVKRLLGE
jgi:hypothetical protein